MAGPAPAPHRLRLTRRPTPRYRVGAFPVVPPTARSEGPWPTASIHQPDRSPTRSRGPPDRRLGRPPAWSLAAPAAWRAGSAGWRRSGSMAAGRRRCAARRWRRVVAAAARRRRPVESSLPFASADAGVSPRRGRPRRRRHRRIAAGSDHHAPSPPSSWCRRRARWPTPGVYRLPRRRAGRRPRAGGRRVHAPADPDRINLAAPLADGERVWIPAEGEDEPPEVVAGGGSGAGPARMGRRRRSHGSPAGERHAPPNRSTSTRPPPSSSTRCPGVGPATAAAILAYRDQHGRSPRSTTCSRSAASATPSWSSSARWSGCEPVAAPVRDRSAPAAAETRHRSSATGAPCCWRWPSALGAWWHRPVPLVAAARGRRWVAVAAIGLRRPLLLAVARLRAGRQPSAPAPYDGLAPGRPAPVRRDGHPRRRPRHHRRSASKADVRVDGHRRVELGPPGRRGGRRRAGAGGRAARGSQGRLGPPSPRLAVAGASPRGRPAHGRTGPSGSGSGSAPWRAANRFRRLLASGAARRCPRPPRSLYGGFVLGDDRDQPPGDRRRLPGRRASPTCSSSPARTSRSCWSCVVAAARADRRGAGRWAPPWR